MEGLRLVMFKEGWECPCEVHFVVVLHWDETVQLGPGRGGKRFKIAREILPWLVVVGHPRVGGHHPLLQGVQSLLALHREVHALRGVVAQSELVQSLVHLLISQAVGGEGALVAPHELGHGVARLGEAAHDLTQSIAVRWKSHLSRPS